MPTSNAGQAQIEMWERVAPPLESATRPPEPPPTVHQIYALARLLAERARSDWPASRGDASALIRHLRGQSDQADKSTYRLISLVIE